MGIQLARDSTHTLLVKTQMGSCGSHLDRDDQGSAVHTFLPSNPTPRNIFERNNLKNFLLKDINRVTYNIEKLGNC